MSERVLQEFLGIRNRGAEALKLIEEKLSLLESRMDFNFKKVNQTEYDNQFPISQQIREINDRIDRLAVRIWNKALGST